jgi:tRNA(fMet)-specific endonuclease VapC
VTLVDTDVLIDILKGRASAGVRQALTGRALSTTAISAYELRRGATTEKSLASIEMVLGRMTAIAPFDDLSATRAAALYRALSRGGRLIGKADLYIAGACLASGAQLLTRNVREYGRVPGLQLVEP